MLATHVLPDAVALHQTYTFTPALHLLHCMQCPFPFLVLLTVSGEVPQEPVVSRTHGHLFEKRLIEKYIAETGKCPITNEDMTDSDLISLQGTYLCMYM